MATIFYVGVSPHRVIMALLLVRFAMFGLSPLWRLRKEFHSFALALSTLSQENAPALHE
ncbi:hypothetical protein [Escherichia coli]|uniref:hypothetical protein n=1 Tax=Escherichia coli TaxID=562 RepID=UPI001F11021B|nr:hypothetical protein [Escherichia coli]